MEVSVGYHVEYALKILVEASWRNRQLVIRDALTSPMFLNEYCTIRMSTARRSGHTSSLLSVSRLFKSPIVLFPNVSMADHVLKRDDVCRNLNGKYLSFRQLDHARGYDYDAILVDCAFMLGSGDLERVKQMCSACLTRYQERFCLVLVG